MTWTRVAHYFVFVVQIVLCVQLYLTQVSLDSKLNDLDSFQRSMVAPHSRLARSVESDEVDSAATTEVTASSGGRHHRKNNRVSVSKYLVSTESTTVAPVMQRHSRVKSTGMRLRTAQEEQVGEVRERRGHSPIAVHYVGFISPPYRHHVHGYIMNDRIRVNEDYKHWREANWTADLWPNGNKHFRMRDGKVSVSRTGLYLLYAQIHYATNQTYNCYQAKVNDGSIAQCCSTAIHEVADEHKATTCSLVTTAFLHSGDQVYLHDLHSPEVILNDYRSFFGLVQLISR